MADSSLTGVHDDGSVTIYKVRTAKTRKPPSLHIAKDKKEIEKTIKFDTLILVIKAIIFTVW